MSTTTPALPHAAGAALERPPRPCRRAGPRAGRLALCLAALLAAGCGVQPGGTAPPSPTPDPRLTSPLVSAATLWVGYGALGTTAEAMTKGMGLLHAHGVTGVVEYSSPPGNAVLDAQITSARALGMKVMLGVWSPVDAAEIANAVALANAPGSPVVAIVVGNEGVSVGRYTVPEVWSAVVRVRAATHVPVTTTEPVLTYFDHPELARIGDFIFPNVHPYYAFATTGGGCTPFTADAGVRWTLDEMAALQRLAPDKPMYAKETGFPTAGDCRVSERLQAAFYCRLRQRTAAFVHFEAFDIPMKASLGRAIEAHWGFFRSDLTPKPAALDLPRC